MRLREAPSADCSPTVPEANLHAPGVQTFCAADASLSFQHSTLRVSRLIGLRSLSPYPRS